MITLSHIVRTARACRARLQAERRDPWPLVVFGLLLFLFGDDVVIWIVGQLAPPAASYIREWGTATTSVLLGVVPALALAGWVLAPEWRESWRATRD